MDDAIGDTAEGKSKAGAKVGAEGDAEAGTFPSADTAAAADAAAADDGAPPPPPPPVPPPDATSFGALPIPPSLMSGGDGSASTPTLLRGCGLGRCDRLP